MSIRLFLAKRKTKSLQDHVRAQLHELDGLASALRLHMRLMEEFNAVRDAEPDVTCTRCEYTHVKRGDFRCCMCGARNESHVDRGLDPPVLPMFGGRP